MSSTTHPVDSTTRPCCGGIGAHTRDCLPIPAGATSVDNWDGDSREFDVTHLKVEAEWMTLGITLGGTQQVTGEVVRRYIFLSSDTGHGLTDIANGPLSIDEARTIGATLIAAADELDRLADCK